MARFLHGLNKDTDNIVKLQHYVEVEDMVHMAMKVERQLKLKGTTKSSSNFNNSWKSNWKKDDKGSSKYKIESTKKAIEGESSQAKGKSTSQSSRSRDIKRFKCLGIGHMALQCPNKKVMILKDNGEVESKSEEDIISIFGRCK